MNAYKHKIEYKVFGFESLSVQMLDEASHKSSVQSFWTETTIQQSSIEHKDFLLDFGWLGIIHTAMEHRKNTKESTFWPL